MLLLLDLKKLFEIKTNTLDYTVGGQLRQQDD